MLGLLAGEVGDALDVVGEAGSALLEEGAEEAKVSVDLFSKFLLQMDEGKQPAGLDDFIQAMQSIRSALELSGIIPTPATMRPGLERFAAERRELYLAAATNSFGLEQRQRQWQRVQISGLSARK